MTGGQTCALPICFPVTISSPLTSTLSANGPLVLKSPSLSTTTGILGNRTRPSTTYNEAYSLQIGGPGPNTPPLVTNELAQYQSGLQISTTPLNLTGVSTGTINQLREAFQMQKFLERDARGGTRYNELVYSHFGVTLPDAQHRPEYLGGGTIDLNINPVTIGV